MAIKWIIRKDTYMRKKGFTLAEVMIAMSLIGIITSLTIPTFITSNKNKSHAAKLSTTIAAVENAFVSMIAAEAVNDLTETDFYSSTNANTLGKYLKLEGSDTSLANLGYPAAPFKYMDSTGFNPSYTIVFRTKSGAVLILNKTSIKQKEEDVKKYGGSISEGIGYMDIDVNGPSKPNMWGRDVFRFVVGIDGMLYPCGGLNYSILAYNSNTGLWDIASKTNEINAACNGSNKKIGCTARLIDKNFEPDY